MVAFYPSTRFRHTYLFFHILLSHPPPIYTEMNVWIRSIWSSLSFHLFLCVYWPAAIFQLPSSSGGTVFVIVVLATAWVAKSRPTSKTPKLWGLKYRQLWNKIHLKLPHNLRKLKKFFKLRFLAWGWASRTKMNGVITQAPKWLIIPSCLFCRKPGKPCLLRGTSCRGLPRMQERDKLRPDWHLSFTSSTEREEWPHVQVTQHLSQVLLCVHEKISECSRIMK